MFGDLDTTGKVALFICLMVMYALGFCFGYLKGHTSGQRQATKSQSRLPEDPGQ